MAYRIDYVITACQFNIYESQDISKQLKALLGAKIECMRKWIWFGNCENWEELDSKLFLLSKKFPKLLFSVSFFGQDRNDIWQEYWENGSSQMCVMEMTPYDKNKMIPYELIDGKLTALLPDKLNDQKQEIRDARSRTKSP